MHSLRDLGIREAKGDYILHFNSDNILYPNALEEISKTIERPPRIFDTQTGRPVDNNEVIVYGIVAHGYNVFKIICCATWPIQTFI